MTDPQYAPVSDLRSEDWEIRLKKQILIDSEMPRTYFLDSDLRMIRDREKFSLTYILSFGKIILHHDR
jgi:hypothetical protein